MSGSRAARLADPVSCQVSVRPVSLTWCRVLRRSRRVRAAAAPGARRVTAQTAVTRLRRLQMEVHRAIRLDLPDQSMPWFTDVYAKVLPGE